MDKTIALLIALGMCFLPYSEKAETEQRLRQTIQLDSALIHQRIATELHILGRNEEAEKEYRQTIQLNPLYALAHYNLGLLLAEQKRYDEAEKEWRKVVSLTPKDADAHYNLGILLQALKRYNDAEKEFREAIQLDPKDIYARNSLGVLLIELKRYNEAAKCFRESIRLNSTYSEYYSNLGYLLIVLKRYREAEKEFQEAIQLNSEDSLAHYNLGILLKEQKRYSEAKEEFRMAIAIYPPFWQCKIAFAEAWVDSAEIVDDKELYETALDKLNEGISDMLKSSNISTTEQAAIYNLRGFVLTKLNQFEKAKEDFEKALKLDLNYPKAMRNLKLITATLLHPKPFRRSEQILKLFSITFFSAALGIFILFIAKLARAQFSLKKMNVARFGSIFVFLFVLGIIAAILRGITASQIGPSELEVERDSISSPIVSTSSFDMLK